MPIHKLLKFSLVAGILATFTFVGFATEGATPHAVADTVVMKNLSRPWAVLTGPDGNIWITEKTGTVKIFSPQFGLLKTLSGFPDFAPFGEGGVLDLTFHPKFRRTGWLYVAYSVSDGAGGYFTRVNRFTYRGGALTEHKVIFNGPSGTAGTTSAADCFLMTEVFYTPRSVSGARCRKRKTRTYRTEKSSV